MRSFNNADTFSLSLWWMSQLFNQDSPVNPLHQCLILEFIDWHHLSSNFFCCTGELKCTAQIYTTTIFVNVTVCGETTTAAKIVMRRGFLMLTVSILISAGFWCWHRYCAVVSPNRRIYLMVQLKVTHCQSDFSSAYQHWLVFVIRS